MTKNNLRFFLGLFIVLISVNILFATLENKDSMGIVTVNQERPAENQEQDKLNNMEISYAWFSMECQLVNQQGNPISDAEVQLYCVDLTTEEEQLFFEGFSNSDGYLNLTTVRDVYQVPEIFIFKLNVKKDDMDLSRTYAGTLDYDDLFEELKTITVTVGENASLFESEWVAQKQEVIESDAYVTFNAVPAVVGRCIWFNIKTLPDDAEVYVNDVYLGNTPLDDMIPIESIFLTREVYIFRIQKEGYQNEIIEVDINSEENQDQEMIFIDELIELRKIEE